MTGKQLVQGCYAFSISTIRVWNSLPSAIRANISGVTFRRHLKTDYFIPAFNWLELKNNNSESQGDHGRLQERYWRE